MNKLIGTGLTEVSSFWDEQELSVWNWLKVVFGGYLHKYEDFNLTKEKK